MKIVTKWLAAAGSMMLLLYLFACNKSNSSGSNPNIPPGKSQLSISMMDGPVSYTKVLIDIRQVAVLIDTASKQSDADEDDEWDDNFCGRHRGEGNKSVIWDTLNIKPGVYDLLQLRNGADTLLGTGIYPSGKILKVRIMLGSDNTVYTDSSTFFPLVVWGPNPYFTVNVRRENISVISNNDFKLWLDFNLARSIHYWSGTFYLKPWITVFNDVFMAKLQGRVLPENAGALVMAWNGADTLYAIPNEDGKYQFRNVPTGSWSMTFKGHEGFQDTTITNISVDSMKVVNVPTIRLHP